MFSLVDIVRRDAATYYEYGSNRPLKRSKTLALFAVAALAMGALVGKASDEFLNGALAAQAILVGFSFNVLFYLVANRLTAPAIYASIEHELRFERLSTLSDEVFDNVTYFNLVAIFSALVALALLLFASEGFVANLHVMADFIKAKTGICGEIFWWGSRIASSLSLALLVFLLCESIFTFLRAVSRVRFYFGMLKTMDADNQSLA